MTPDWLRHIEELDAHFTVSRDHCHGCQERDELRKEQEREEWNREWEENIRKADERRRRTEASDRLEREYEKLAYALINKVDDLATIAATRAAFRNDLAACFDDDVTKIAEAIDQKFATHPDYLTAADPAARALSDARRVVREIHARILASIDRQESGIREKLMLARAARLMEQGRRGPNLAQDEFEVEDDLEQDEYEQQVRADERGDLDIERRARAAVDVYRLTDDEITIGNAEMQVEMGTATEEDIQILKRAYRGERPETDVEREARLKQEGKKLDEDVLWFEICRALGPRCSGCGREGVPVILHHVGGGDGRGNRHREALGGGIAVQRDLRARIRAREQITDFQLLCVKCHDRLHYGKPRTGRPQKARMPIVEDPRAKARRYGTRSA